FVWRRVARRVLRADGPERIAPEWWSALPGASPRARDYYRVEDAEGRRYWVFREGLYRDQKGGPPQWFVHGLLP
ncbi:MAG: DNA polymerase Y family protein, partial [Pseudomonadota bacterium]